MLRRSYPYLTFFTIFPDWFFLSFPPVGVVQGPQRAGRGEEDAGGRGTAGQQPEEEAEAYEGK